MKAILFLFGCLAVVNAFDRAKEDSEVSQLNFENSNNDEEVSQLNLPSKLENKIQNCIVIRVTSVETPIQECEKRYSSDYNKQRKCLYNNNLPEITSCFTLYG
jgi:hypothetical protein